MNQKTKMFNARRGQVTLFIIIGIIVLISMALMVYVNQKISEREDFESLVGTIPENVQPVKDFIEKCLDDIGTQSIVLIGESGGYIELNKTGSGLVMIPRNPTSSEGIEIIEGTDMIIPYWLYMSASNECQGNCQYDISMIPELTKTSINDLSIENQISRYVEQELPGCIQNFNSFFDVGMDVKDGELLVDTVITSQNVQIKMKYPINITYDNHETKMDLFSKKFDVKLYYAYWLARMLVFQQSQDFYLEQSMANLITAFGGVDNIIPPMYGGTDFDANAPQKSWKFNDVKNHIKNILYAYVPNLKVSNTFSEDKVIIEDGGSTWSEVVNKMNYLILLKQDLFFPLDVEFNYLPNWDIHLDINPSNGGIIKPDKSGAPFLEYLGLGMTRYDFSYDVSYPVMVKLTDPNAFNKEGYQFYFAMESNLRNNQAVLAANSDNYISPSDAKNDESKLLCQNETKRTGNITVKAIDYITKEPIENVEVFSAFQKVQCREGTTDELGLYSGIFQSGIGYMTLSNINYLKMHDFFVFGLDKTANKEYVLYPKKTLNVTVKKVILSKLNRWEISHEEEFLNQNGDLTETVMIQLKRVKDNVSREEYQKNIMFSQDFSPQELELYPGKYTMNIIYMNSEEFTIPEDRRKKDGEKFTVPAVTMSLTSNIDINGPDIYLEILPTDLYRSKQIEIKVLVPNYYENESILKVEDLQLLEKLSDKYENLYEVIKPQLR